MTDIKFKQFYSDILKENVEPLVPRFLYHSTLYVFLPSIKQHGIVPGGKECKIYDWCSSDYVYLGKSKAASEGFVSLSGAEEGISDEQYERLTDMFASGGVTLKIDTRKLNRNLFEKDPHWNGDEGYSFVYKGIIPYSAIVKTYKFIPD